MNFSFLLPAYWKFLRQALVKTSNKKTVENYRILLRDYAGRPSPLYFAENISKEVGAKVYLKREDLINGGSHKINNTLGQALLAKYIGKNEIITG